MGLPIEHLRAEFFFPPQMDFNPLEMPFLAGYALRSQLELTLHLADVEGKLPALPLHHVTQALQSGVEGRLDTVKAPKALAEPFQVIKRLCELQVVRRLLILGCYRPVSLVSLDGSLQHILFELVQVPLNLLDDQVLSGCFFAVRFLQLLGRRTES